MWIRDTKEEEDKGGDKKLKAAGDGGEKEADFLWERGLNLNLPQFMVLTTPRSDTQGSLLPKKLPKVYLELAIFARCHSDLKTK